MLVPRLWLLTWLVLLPLAVAQTGTAELVGDSLASLIDAGEPEGACEERCPGEADGGECPPLCDYCMCCPRAVPGDVSGPALAGPPVIAIAELPPAQDRRSAGSLQRVFRPPRAEPAC